MSHFLRRDVESNSCSKNLGSCLVLGLDLFESQRRIVEHPKLKIAARSKDMPLPIGVSRNRRLLKEEEKALLWRSTSLAETRQPSQPASRASRNGDRQADGVRGVFPFRQAKLSQKRESSGRAIELLSAGLEWIRRIKGCENTIWVVCLGSWVLVPQSHAGRCSPTGICRACTTCNYCKNCAERGGAYYKNFEPPPPGTRFSIEWGLEAPETLGAWCEYDFDYAVAEIRKKGRKSRAQELGGARCSTEGAIRGKSVRRRVHSDP